MTILQHFIPRAHYESGGQLILLSQVVHLNEENEFVRW